ncbi:MAG: universal stress protein [Flavobacteriales bacterium]|nr:universal stress protein [Flavobacteriales bacterium]
MASKTYIVPHDFTSVADTALNHASVVAKTTGAEVILLHVVSKPAQIDEVKGKLENIAAEASKAGGISCHANVRIGNIFDDIGAFASEHNASLIFMGTHGARGWQKIVGSDAMKIITNSEVPFVVVQQKKIKNNGYDDIIVPMDLERDTKQKLSIVADMAKYFNSRIHIVLPNEDDEYLVHQLNSNIAFAKKFLGDRGIEFTTRIAEGSLDKECVRLSAELDADLIAIMNHQGNRLTGGMFANSAEQQLITNDAEIPVMIVNPIDTGVSGSVLFS